MRLLPTCLSVECPFPSTFFVFVMTLGKDTHESGFLEQLEEMERVKNILSGGV